MFNFDACSLALATVAAVAFAAWSVGTAKRNVGIVDSVWAVFFLAGAMVYAAAVPDRGPRSALILTLVALWAARLSGYVTWRNWGEPEDHRYRAIRRRNERYFTLKSLYLVFGLQALLAWIVSAPLLAGIASPAPINALDYGGVVLWAFGFLFESIADFQLARFKRTPANRDKVMDRGLWRYTRHPNYFGEFCLWWGFYLIAVAAGGWWAIVSPLLLSFLLLKVSGVALLERDIGSRRPGYGAYSARTPAFFPGPPKRMPTARSAR